MATKRTQKPTSRRAPAGQAQPTFIIVPSLGAAHPAALAAPLQRIDFRLSITDNSSPVSTNGKIFMEGAGPGSVPVISQDVPVTHASPAPLSLPPGAYVYWFMAQGQGSFTLNQDSASGAHGTWHSYTAPTMDAFHFTVHP